MTKDAKNKLKVFYSWQSDSPKESNSDGIRQALSLAALRVEAKDPKIKVIVDEATRETSGSPNIALKILEKIEGSDLFIADVTTVTALGAKRPCPNPNVGYELGFAVAHLGWDRIILLFNKELGAFPTDLPFDFAQHRASPYRLKGSGGDAQQNKLADLLETALSAVIEKAPKRPAELKGLTRHEKEHDHDVENIRWLMSAIHVPTLQEHIEQLPHQITDKALWFYENYRGVACNALFSVYDPVLKSNIDALTNAWTTAVSFDQRYHSTPNGLQHIFSNPGDGPLTPKQQADWEAIETARVAMARAFSAILDRIRAGYIEITLLSTNKKAWSEYIEFQRELDDDLRPIHKKKTKSREKKKKKT